MKITIRRALVASATAVAATGIALAAPAAASAVPQVHLDQQGVVVTFNDVDAHTDDVIEDAIDAANDFTQQETGLSYENIKGSRSAVAWNPNPTYLIECTQAEANNPAYLCWSVLDD